VLILRDVLGWPARDTAALLDSGVAAAAAYVRLGEEPAYRAFAIAVLAVADGKITELTGFHDPALFPAFGLPLELTPAHR
jgi:ketosteroid isomerase-like protein